MHLEIPVCIAPPGLSVICFCKAYPFSFAFAPSSSSFVIYPCESYKFYQPRNLGICWIYYVTPLDCSRLWDRCVLQIEKARTREWEETCQRKGGLCPSPFSQSCAHIFVCLSLTRHSYCLRGWNQSLVSSRALYCLIETWIAQTSC